MGEPRCEERKPPMSPQPVGRGLGRVRDSAGHLVAEEMIEKRSEAEGAWVHYKWPQPVMGAVVVFGLSLDILPQLYVSVPAWLLFSRLALGRVWGGF